MKIDRVVLVTLGIVLGLFLSAESVLAQGDPSVHGIVVARADRALLPDTKLVLQSNPGGLSYETAAEADGRFSFSRVVPGDYILTASRDGFQDERYRLNLRPRDIENLTVEMTLRPVTQTVEVTADTTANSTPHSPGSTLLTAGRLDRLPLAQRTNLTDAIVTASPGMIRGHDDFVHIRGHEVALNPSINGVSFWENAHSVFSPGLGVDYIESINVMTGGFAAEYGNRFGGILDVVTKSGFRMNDNGSLTLGVGSALRNNAGAEFGGHTGHVGYYVNAAGFESSRFLSPPEPRAIHDTGRGSRAFAQLEFALGKKDFVKAILMGDGTNFELPKTERDEQLRPDFNNFERTRSQSSIVSWDHAASGKTQLQSAFYQKWSETRLLPNTDPFGAKLDADRKLGTWGIKTSITRFFNRHTLKSGIDLVMLRPDESVYYLSQPWIAFTHLPEVDEEHIHFRGPDLGAGIPRPVIFQQQKTGGQGSLYLQDKIQVTRNLTADVGLRFDRYSLAVSDSEFSPRVNVAYRFGPMTELYASYNHFFVPPPVENVLASSAGLTQYISEIAHPLPPLLPIKENQFELGLTQPLRNGIKLGVTGYYRHSDDPLHTVLFPDSRFYAYGSFDKGKSYGVEVKAEIPEIQSTGVSGYFNYAWGRVWFYNPVHAGFITEADHLTETDKFLAPMDQTHTLTSGVSYHHHRSRLWGTLAFEYGSGTPGSHDVGEEVPDPGDPGHTHAPVPGGCGVRCPARFTENLSMGWDAVRTLDGRHGITLQLNVENLSNSVYLVSKESTFVQGQYSIPRLFSAAMKIRF